MIELASVAGTRSRAELAIQTAERLGALLVTEHAGPGRLRSHTLQTLVRLGQTQRAEQILTAMDGTERDTGQMRNAVAVLRLAQDDPKAATAALAPVLNGSVPLVHAQPLGGSGVAARGDRPRCARRRGRRPGAPWSAP